VEKILSEILKTLKEIKEEIKKINRFNTIPSVPAVPLNPIWDQQSPFYPANPEITCKISEMKDKL
jgi:hypothetical protein